MSRPKNYEEDKRKVLKDNQAVRFRTLKAIYQQPLTAWLLFSYWIDLIIIRVRQALSR